MSYFSKNFKEIIPKGYVIFARNTPVNGIKFEYEAAVKFIRSKEAQSLEFIPEATNPKDPNAIKVIGVTISEKFFLGYVPKELAKQIAESGLINNLKPRLMRVYKKEKFLDVIFQIIGLKEDKPQFDKYQPIEPATISQVEYLQLLRKIIVRENLSFPDAMQMIEETSPKALTLFSSYDSLMADLTDPDFCETNNIKILNRSEILQTLEDLIVSGVSFESILEDTENLLEKLTDDMDY